MVYSIDGPWLQAALYSIVLMSADCHQYRPTHRMTRYENLHWPSITENTENNKTLRINL